MLNSFLGSRLETVVFLLEEVLRFKLLCGEVEGFADVAVLPDLVLVLGIEF